LTEVAIEKGHSELLEKFPKSGFDAISIADYTSGWDLSSSSSFAAFAKDKDLDVNAFIRRIDGNAQQIDPRVGKFLLKREREARRTLVSVLTPLHLLDLMGEKIDKLDEPTKNRAALSSAQTNAIARTILPVVKHVMSTWMVAKMAVRSAILKDRNNPKHMKLLKSSLWDKDIFSEQAIQDVENSTVNNLPRLLGLTPYNQPKGNNYFNQPHKKMRTAPQTQRQTQTQQNNFHNQSRNQPFRRGGGPRKPQFQQIARRAEQQTNKFPVKR